MDDQETCRLLGSFGAAPFVCADSNLTTDGSLNVNSRAMIWKAAVSSMLVNSVAAGTSQPAWLNRVRRFSAQ